MVNSQSLIYENSYNYAKFAVRIFVTCFVFYVYSNYLIEILPFLDKPVKAFRAVADILIILVSIFSFREKSNRSIQLFIGIYFSLSLLTFAINAREVSFSTHLNGIRDPLLFLCSLAFYNYIMNSNQYLIFIRRFNKFLLFFAISQIPIAFSQFIKYGANDYVGGSFSNGGSGMLTLIVFTLSFYFILNYASNKHFRGFNVLKTLPLLILLIPVFINETKISIFILIVFFITLTLNKRKILTSIIYSFVGVLLIILFSYVYNEVGGGKSDTKGKLEEFLSLDFVVMYAYGGQEFEYSESDIPRFYKLVLLYDVLSNDNMLMFFGKGYGIYKGQNFLGVTDAQKKYYHIYRGSKTLITTAVLQGGIFLLVVLLIAMFYFLFAGMRESQLFNFMRFRIFLIFIVILMIAYNDAVFVNYISIIFSYFIMYVYNEKRTVNSITKQF